jgi:hypothetical protein
LIFKQAFDHRSFEQTALHQLHREAEGGPFGRAENV